MTERDVPAADDETTREERDRARRQAERAKAHAYWTRPIEGIGHRLTAWTHMLAADHGIVRLFYANRHRIDEAMWRSAQPAPHDVAWAAKNGIRTIINLRGGRSFGSWPLQREACEKHGIAIAEMPLYSRSLPPPEVIHAAKRTFDEIAYPALMHCKAGADRSGLAAALYLLLKRNAPIEDAQAQLHLRYGHMRSARTGVLDSFLETYRVEGAARGKSFLEWVDSDYDPEAIAASYEPKGLASVLVDRVLRRE